MGGKIGGRRCIAIARLTSMENLGSWRSGICFALASASVSLHYVA